MEGRTLQTQPAVSVVVPCYNTTAFIADALDSLNSQTFRDFETIVVNDGCPDTANLERVLQPYMDNVVFLKQENRGLAGARNTAIRAARAPLIALLDSDDVWEPNYLEDQVRFLRNRPEVDVVHPNATFIGDSALAGRLFTDLCPAGSDTSFHTVVSGQCYIFVGVTARKDRVTRNGWFDESLRAAEDLDLWLRLLHANVRFAHNARPLVRYRMRQSSLSDDRSALGVATLRVYGKLLKELTLSPAERSDLVGAISRVNAELDLVEAKKALYRGNYAEASRLFALANRTFQNGRLRLAALALKVWPALLSRYVHRRFPTEREYLH
jgi:glycosyltransferase involved in cell wall biosynthesis